MFKGFNWIQLFCLLIVLTQVSFGQDDWRKIVVMESTRADVERLLGSPSEDSIDFYALYHIGSGRLRVSYSTGFCKSDQIGRWNVEKGIVDGVILFLNEEISIRELKLDKKKYQKSFDGDTDFLRYSNDVDGIRYIVKNGKVRHIIRFPGTRFDSLRCRTMNNLLDDGRDILLPVF